MRSYTINSGTAWLSKPRESLGFIAHNTVAKMVCFPDRNSNGIIEGFLLEFGRIKLLANNEKSNATTKKNFDPQYLLKFIYSEKATKFCEISIVNLSYVVTVKSTQGGNFAKLCGLLRIYELYLSTYLLHIIHLYIPMGQLKG